MIEQMTTALIIGLLICLTGCNVIPNEMSMTMYHEDRTDRYTGDKTKSKANGISGTATWYIR